jgi:hypothetical protein
MRLMKAQWKSSDCTKMAWKPLPFSPEDVDFIYRGLKCGKQAAQRPPAAIRRFTSPKKFSSIRDSGRPLSPISVSE